MPQAKLTIGELEAGYPMYCKALRRLLQQGKTVQDIERTVCWGHLETLNRCLPTRYKSPSYLLALIRRALVEFSGNRSQVARELGINRTTLYNKLRVYGIEEG